MPAFVYKAIDKLGRDVDGTLDADSEVVAISQLRDMGYFPLDVRKEKVARAGGDISSFLERFRRKRIKIKDLSIFARQLATLMDSGLPLLRSLDVLGEQTENPSLKAQIKSVAQSVQGGSTFSDALTRYPRTFSKLFVNMVKAGEIGGVLEITLARVAEFVEKEVAIRGKVKSALAYPAIVIIVGIGVVTFVTVAIIPTFVSMFQEVGVSLPLPTQIMITISNFVRQRWYIILGTIVALILMYRQYAGTERGKMVIDKAKFRLPVVGNLVQKAAISRFSRTLGTLLNSGVAILQALLIVKDTAGNEVIARAMVDVHDSIREGESIAGPIERSGVFPPMVTHMIAVGEETGALDTMLIKVADGYDREVDDAVNALTSILEPVLIVCMAAVVGFIVVAIYLPIFNMGALVGG